MTSEELWESELQFLGPLKNNPEFALIHMSIFFPRYKKTLRNLEDCWVKDEEEEKKKNAELVKLYLNEALCHFKLGHPTLCIQACKNVHLLDDRNCKNHFRSARFLLHVILTLPLNSLQNFIGFADGLKH